MIYTRAKYILNQRTHTKTTFWSKWYVSNEKQNILKFFVWTYENEKNTRKYENATNGGKSYVTTLEHMKTLNTWANQEHNKNALY